jgi:hypothetical protein
MLKAAGVAAGPSIVLSAVWAGEGVLVVATGCAPAAGTADTCCWAEAATAGALGTDIAFAIACPRTNG